MPWVLYLHLEALSYIPLEKIKDNYQMSRQTRVMLKNPMEFFRLARSIP